MKKGLFITFEGPEGCGKSTQSRLLYEYLKQRGYRCIYTREPGGTKVGEAIRKVLLDSKGLEISGLAELLLFEAARAQIVKDVVAPALERREVVISDRFSDATFAYQGYCSRLDLGVIRKIDMVSTGGMVPDLTILLDIDTSLGLRRATRVRRDRMEEKPFAYHASVRGGYLAIAKANPKRIKVIKPRGTIGRTQGAVRRKVECVIQRYKRTG